MRESGERGLRKLLVNEIMEGFTFRLEEVG